jgi:hypothetical protein
MSHSAFLAFCILGTHFRNYPFFQWSYGVHHGIF